VIGDGKTLLRPAHRHAVLRQILEAMERALVQEMAVDVV
tara:strand:- start:268 stop:384 length:117 start_codon:yes stop_codon:yes gene_type:complete